MSDDRRFFELAELYLDGSVRPVIDRRYPLTQVVEALRYVDEGRARRKVVVHALDEGPNGPSAADESPEILAAYAQSGRAVCS